MPSAASPSLRPEIDRIIQAGREPVAGTGSAKPVFAAALLSGLLLWISFTPLDFAPAAWVAIVPLCLLFRVDRLPRFSYRVMMAAAFAWALVTLQWMRLGHVTMYGALLALSFYLSLYPPVFVAIGRTVMRTGCPMWLAVPIVWTALEYVRAYLWTGFSWYYLGHSQYQWTWLIQISDITGAYGVSFLIALVSGALAECLPAGLLVRLRLAESTSDIRTISASRRVLAVVLAVGGVLGACLYGWSRVLPADGDGPVIAVAQGNFTPELKHDPTEWNRMWMDHNLLSRTAAGLRPELIVWPETMFPEPDVIIADGVTDNDLVGSLTMPGSVSNSDHAHQVISRWRDQRARTLLTNVSQETGSAMLIGLLTEVHEEDQRRRYNSAAFIRPDLGYVGRYDKIHRVIFGEYIPLRDILPWLARLTPFSAGFGIDAGTQPQVFEYARVRYAPIICFEDTVPHLVRDVANTSDASGNTPDVLINMTNDGWFRGSSELDQHLITAAFRCVETRRPMVRAVNAGISAFIDSCGRIRQPEHFYIMEEDSAGVIADFTEAESLKDPATGRRYRQVSAVLCGQLPLDGRISMYLKFGDWFAILCGVLATCGMVAGRMRKPRPDDGGTPPDVVDIRSAA
ncbi:MAG: apolipoprotein N-acyltransferase [Fuerstiella sp.]